MGETRLCVLCGLRPEIERWKPFCSERCRNEDLARWAEGRYRVASEPAPNTESEDGQSIDEFTD